MCGASDHIVAHGSCLRNTGRIDCLRHRNGCGIRPTRASIVMADEYLIVSIVLAQNTEATGVRNPSVQTRCGVGAERDTVGWQQFKFGDTPLHQYHRGTGRSKTLTVASKGQSEIIDRGDLTMPIGTQSVKGLSRSSSLVRAHQPAILFPGNEIAYFLGVVETKEHKTQWRSRRSSAN
jgi:hypothetical protein